MNRLLYVLIASILLCPVTCFSEATVVDYDGKFSGQWVEGTIAKSPYKTEYLKMKIGRVTYVLQPGYSVFTIVEKPDGKIYEENAKLSDLKIGKRVSAMAHANRITKILILN
jgi:hypothetical protein